MELELTRWTLADVPWTLWSPKTKVTFWLFLHLR